VRVNEPPKLPPRQRHPSPTPAAISSTKPQRPVTRTCQRGSLPTPSAISKPWDPVPFSLKRVNGAPVPSSLQHDNEPSGFLRVNEAHWPPSPQSRQQSPSAQSPRITTHFQLERDNEPPAFSTSTGPIANLLCNLVDKALGPSPHLERVSKAPPSCTSNTPTRPHRLAFSALNTTPTPPLQ